MQNNIKKLGDIYVKYMKNKSEEIAERCFTLKTQEGIPLGVSLPLIREKYEKRFIKLCTKVGVVR